MSSRPAFYIIFLVVEKVQENVRTPSINAVYNMD